MHTVGRRTDLFVPRFLGNRIHFCKDMLELKSVPRRTYDTGNLRCRSDIDLESIFKSAEINNAWEEARSQLEQFRIPDGTGGVNPGDRRAVFHLIRALKPVSVLEVGTHIGASTVHVASALHSLQREEGRAAQLVTVDATDVNSPETRHWLDFGASYSPRQMIEKLGYDNFVTFVTNMSLAYMRNCGKQFDFIFLDGDHSAKTVYTEVSVALKLLNPGGVILLHDYFPMLKPLWSNGAVVTGPYIATERLLKEGVDAKVVPLGRLPWRTKLDSRYTSLALLLKDE